MSGTNRISGLADILAEAERSGMPPVEAWDPPYCGDIGLRIARDGTWFYRDSAIQRPRLVKLFSRVLRRDEDDRHYLVTPVEKVDVAVDDAPFLAVEMQVEGSGADQTIVFRTNVDDVVTCGPDHPLFVRDVPQEAGSGGFKPYVRVRGRLDALLARSLVPDLVELALEGEADEALHVRSGGMTFRLQG